MIIMIIIIVIIIHQVKCLQCTFMHTTNMLKLYIPLGKFVKVML